MYYTKENTRFLSQYGDPTSEQLTREYTTESRPYLLPAGFHVIPVVTGKEKQEYGLPRAKWMKPYTVHFIYTVGDVNPTQRGSFRKHVWPVTNVLRLPAPIFLPMYTRPKQSPLVIHAQIHFDILAQFNNLFGQVCLFVCSCNQCSDNHSSTTQTTAAWNWGQTWCYRWRALMPRIFSQNIWKGRTGTLHNAL